MKAESSEPHKQTLREYGTANLFHVHMTILFLKNESSTIYIKNEASRFILRIDCYDQGKFIIFITRTVLQDMLVELLQCTGSNLCCDAAH